MTLRRRHPVPAERLALVAIRDPSETQHLAHGVLRVGQARLGGLFEPQCREPLVPDHALAPEIGQSEVVLSQAVVVFRRALPQLRGLPGITRHAEALGVHEAEVVLGRRDALIGRRAVPAGRLAVVLAHLAAAVFVELAEVELGHRIATLGEFLPDIAGALVVALTIGRDAVGNGLGRSRPRRQSQATENETGRRRQPQG